MASTGSFHEPGMFAALYVKGVCNGAKVLEGPVSDWRNLECPITEQEVVWDQY